MSNNKSNFNQALWLGISSVSSMLVSIVSAAILSRYFDKTEYGTYKQIIFVYTTLLTIFQAGLPSVFSYFLPKYPREAGKYIVNKINRILFGLGFLLSVTIFLTSGIVADFLNNPELERGLKLFSPFPFFTLPTLGLEGIYVVNKNTRFVAIYNTITRLLMLLCIVLPVVFIKNSYETAVLGWGLASIFAFVIAMCYKTRPYKDIEQAEEIPHLMKKVLSYTLPIMGTSCVMLFYNSINQLVISRYFGVESFAEFSNGFMPLPFIAIIINPIRIMLIPMVSKAHTEGSLEEAKRFLNTSIKEIALLIVPMVAFCFAFAKPIMVFLYGEQYANSYIFFMIALTFNYCEIFPLQVILNGLGRTKELFIFDLVYTLLLLGINILLIKLNLSSPVVVAIVFNVIQILLRYITPYIYLVAKEKFHPIYGSVFKTVLLITLHAIIIVVISYLASKFIKGLPVVFELAISGILYYLILIGTGRFFGFDYLKSFKRLIPNKK